MLFSIPIKCLRRPKSIPYLLALILAICFAITLVGCTHSSQQSNPFSLSVGGFEGYCDQNHIPIIYQGNQVQIIVPTQFLFESGTVISTMNADTFFAALADYLTHFDLETVRVINVNRQAHASKLLMRSQSAAFVKMLDDYDKNNSIPFVYGAINSGQKNYSLNLTSKIRASYIVIAFRHYVNGKSYN